MMKWIGNATGGPLRDDYEERNRVSSYRGYLFKLRRSQNLLAPQWGKRWFSIEGHFLKWYRQENDLFSSGMIDLKYIRSITKLEPSHPNNINNTTTGNHAVSLVNQPQPFSFMVTSDERNLLLRASSLNEMNAWIRVLHMHADIARGGKGTMVVSDFNQLPLNSNNTSYKMNAVAAAAGAGNLQSNNNNAFGTNGSSSPFGGPSVSIKRNRGLRASLTLEQELDLTLKKLEELEKETINSPTPPNTATSQPNNIHHHRGYYQSPTDEVTAKENNSQYNAPSSPSHYQQMTHKLLKNVASSGFTASPLDESMDSITDAVVRTPKSKFRSPSQRNNTTSNTINVVKQLDRVESFNSIEDISLVQKSNRVKSIRRQQQEQQQQQILRNKLTYKGPKDGAFSSRSESNSYDDYDNNQTRVVRRSQHSNNRYKADLTPISPTSDGDLSDEFDFSSSNHGRSSSNQQRQHQQQPPPQQQQQQQQQSLLSANRNKPQQVFNNHGNNKKIVGQLGSPSNKNKTILPGNNPRKYNNHHQFHESNDSADFIVENIPSLDRYEEEINITRNLGRHGNNNNPPRDQDIPFRKKDFVNTSVGNGNNGGINSSSWNKPFDNIGDHEPVRKSRDFFGIKSAW